MQVIHTSFRSLLRPERRPECGVSIVEFALVLPIFFLIIFGFFDIARYWQTKAALQKAGSEGVTKYAVNRDIKKKGSTATADVEAYNQAYNSIKESIRSRAALLAVSTGSNANNITVDVRLPANQTAFRDNPIQVDVTARFTGTFFPISVDAKTTVSGYAETFRTSAQPLVTDCAGNLYDATDPPGTGGYGVSCPCEYGEYSVKNWNGQCICSSSVLGAMGLQIIDLGGGVQECGCAAGAVPVIGYDFTKWFGGLLSGEQLQGYNNYYMMCCPAGSPITCPGNQSRYASGQFTCDCKCGGAGTVANADGSCSCSDPNKTFNAANGTCGCSANLPACPSGSVRDASTCTCVCNGGATVQGGACVCPNPNMIYNGATCSCPASGVSCTSPMVFNNAQNVCSCVCPSGMTSNGSGGCSCLPAAGGTRHLENGVCKCDTTDAQCGANAKVNQSTCACECQGGSTLQANGSCACPTGFSFDANGQCKCTLQQAACPDKMTLDVNSCTCKCDPSANTVNNTCTCGAGKVFSGNQCVCDPSYCGAPHMSQTPGTCGCTCEGGGIVQTGNQSCACPTGKTYIGNTCSCAPCPDSKMSQNPSNCACSCPQYSTAVNNVCTCNAGRHFEGNVCACDQQQSNCSDPSRMTVPSNTCACTCPSTSTPVNGICTCPTNYAFSGNTCACTLTEAQCPAPNMRVENCQCVCKSGGTWDGSQCKCPGNLTYNNGVCTCQLSTSSCPDPSRMIINGSCQCACPSGSSLVNGQCVCTNANAHFNASNACVCNACTDPKMTQDANCGCTCPAGSTNLNGTCVCTAGSGGTKHFEGNSCVCDNTQGTCTDGRTLNTTTCSCDCPAPLQNSGGLCCPPGATNQSGVCVCGGGKVLATNGLSCVCPTCTNGFTAAGDGTCGCVCAAGRHIPSGVPEYCSPTYCKQGCTFASDGTCSQCPPG